MTVAEAELARAPAVCRHWNLASTIPRIERCSARSDGPCACKCGGSIARCTQSRARQARAMCRPENRPVSLLMRLVRMGVEGF